MHAFKSSADFYFSKVTFAKKKFRTTIRVSNSLDSDQARRFVVSELGSNCLQMLSADDRSSSESRKHLQLIFDSSSVFTQRALPHRHSIYHVKALLDFI